MQQPAPAAPDGIAFRLKNDPRVEAARPPTAYQRLVTAYGHDVAQEPRVAEWTRAAVEARLRADPALRHSQARMHQHRAQVLLRFLTKSKWPLAELLTVTGQPYTVLYRAVGALRVVGLLRIRRGGKLGSTVVLTAAGEAWLVELVEPGSVGE
ncbi:MAG: hypothetical protein H7330_13885 [Hymenobacteraceae bacterium]|nr:hypothetical protein [Hymenobacteraceae bacterium]